MDRLRSLHVCLDQVRFIGGLLDITTMERHIAACLAFEEESLRSGVRREAQRPLHYLFPSGGELERGEFKMMTGLGDRTAMTAMTAVSALICRGLLKSDAPQGKVRFGLALLIAQNDDFPVAGKHVVILDPNEILARKCVSLCQSAAV